MANSGSGQLSRHDIELVVINIFLFYLLTKHSLIACY